MSTHNIQRVSKGEGLDRSVTPICSCGWHGRTEHAHNDYMWSNLEEQEDEHRRDVKERDARDFLPSELEDNGVMGGNCEEHDEINAIIEGEASGESEENYYES